jgi:antitoxin Phd
MEIMRATDAKNRFGLFMDHAKLGPVAIEKQGHSAALMLSIEEYTRLVEIEDAYWIMKADYSEINGYLFPKESENFFKNMDK